MKTWIDIPANSDFSIHNLPFGVYSNSTGAFRTGIAIGNQIIDLNALQYLGFLKDFKLPFDIFQHQFLNEFIGLGKTITSGVRLKIQQLLSDPKSHIKEIPQVFIAQSEVEMKMPIRIGDYTDFYSSIEHATNVGMMFRDPENALLPNWKHIPVGYHGRASSIIESGINIHRPKGQILPKGAKLPLYSASKRLDFELEMACIIGENSTLGESISTSEAEDYIFGMVLFNDWSARDIQKWEYVPLGPFLGKSFASSISPWIVALEALEFVRTDGPIQEPKVLPYLQYHGKKNYDIDLEVSITPKNGESTVICQSNFKYMYWNMAQQIAHHTVNGCNLRIGDMMASGTISGKDKNSYGSMLELSWGGSNPIRLNDGSPRTFIEDYDSITMRGFAAKAGVRVGFGKVENMVLPAK